MLVGTMKNSSSFIRSVQIAFTTNILFAILATTIYLGIGDASPKVTYTQFDTSSSPEEINQ
jgi:hypothetical protein